MKSLDNKKTYVKYDEVIRQISGRDKTDPHNDPAFYTRKVRNTDRAWAELELVWKDKTTMSDVVGIMDKYNLKPHMYCQVD